MIRSDPNSKLIAENRRARFDYFIEETFEAGIVLYGTEVKSLREGRATITEAYASAEGGGIALVNAYIPEYAAASRFNHEPRRVRRLLLHRKQINKLQMAIAREGRTLVCTKMYWDEKGRAKLELALATGKKAHDKREATAARDWQRDKARLMRDKG
ncbi:SsrA-binding protein SmpB [soil metagenome]